MSSSSSDSSTFTFSSWNSKKQAAEQQQQQLKRAIVKPPLSPFKSSRPGASYSIFSPIKGGSNIDSPRTRADPTSHFSNLSYSLPTAQTNTAEYIDDDDEEDDNSGTATPPPPSAYLHDRRLPTPKNAHRPLLALQRDGTARMSLAQKQALLERKVNGTYKLPTKAVIDRLYDDKLQPASEKEKTMNGTYKSPTKAMIDRLYDERQQPASEKKKNQKERSSVSYLMYLLLFVIAVFAFAIYFYDSLSDLNGTADGTTSSFSIADGQQAIGSSVKSLFASTNFAARDDDLNSALQQQQLQLQEMKKKKKRKMVQAILGAGATSLLIGGTAGVGTGSVSFVPSFFTRTAMITASSSSRATTATAAAASFLGRSGGGGGGAAIQRMFSTFRGSAPRVLASLKASRSGAFIKNAFTSLAKLSAARMQFFKSSFQRFVIRFESKLLPALAKLKLK
jgi:hypothetical protein